MKRMIMMIMGAIMFVIPALAVSVCTKNDVVAVMLNPEITTTETGTADNNTKTWKVPFPYGTISGMSTCVSAKGKTGQSTLTTNDTYLESPGGETSVGNCWCKMTHPMNSLWAHWFDNGYPNSYYCASSCTNYCRDMFKNRPALRGLIFGSVADANTAF